MNKSSQYSNQLLTLNHVATITIINNINRLIEIKVIVTQISLTIME